MTANPITPSTHAGTLLWAVSYYRRPTIARMVIFLSRNDSIALAPLDTPPPPLTRLPSKQGRAGKIWGPVRISKIGPIVIKKMN
jgi:hypothetical protein